MARAEAPTVCLGIGLQARAWGGQVTHSGTAPVFTAAERVEALVRDGRVLPQAGSLLIEAATAAIGCV